MMSTLEQNFFNASATLTGFSADASKDLTKARRLLVEIFIENRQLLLCGNGEKHFDIFPPNGLDIQDKVLYTIHSFEQLGKNKDFLEYALTAGAKLVVSIEPVIEHYSSGQELIQLHKTKEYLSGYPDWLADREERNAIEVLHAERVDYGTLKAELYSVFIWRPTMSRF